jgi:hypothetical protein
MNRVERALRVAPSWFFCCLLCFSAFGCRQFRDINLHADAQRPIGVATFPSVRMQVAQPQGDLLLDAEVTLRALRSWVQDAQDGAYPVQLKFVSSIKRERNPATVTACVLTLGLVPANARWTVQSEMRVEAYGTEVHAHTVTERVRETIVGLGAYLGIATGGESEKWDEMRSHLFERNMDAHRRALFETVHKHGREYLSFVHEGGPDAQQRFVQSHPTSLFRALAESRADKEAL